MAKTDKLMWAQKSEKINIDVEIEPMVTEGRTPQWLVNTLINAGNK